MRRIALIAATALAVASPAFAQDTSPGTAPPAPPAGQAPTGAEPPQSRADAAPGQPYRAGTFTDWRLRCVRLEDRPDPCQMNQILLGADGNPTAEVNFFPIQREGVASGATIVTPLETLLTRGVTISVDGGPAETYPFTFCNTQGCVAQIGFTPAEVAAFRAGATAQITIFPASAPEATVSLSMSLSGFTAAFAAVNDSP